MKSLFRPIEDFYCEEDMESNNSTNPKYDDSDSDDECREDEDAEEQEQRPYHGELWTESQCWAPDSWQKVSVGSLNVAVMAWEKYVLNYLGRAKKSFPISDGYGKLGVLSAQPAAEETGLSYVGDHVKWRNGIWRIHDGERNPKAPKGKTSFWMFSKMNYWDVIQHRVEKIEGLEGVYTVRHSCVQFLW